MSESLTDQELLGRAAYEVAGLEAQRLGVDRDALFGVLTTWTQSIYDNGYRIVDADCVVLRATPTCKHGFSRGAQ